MDNGTQSCLTIERISQGGYLVVAWNGEQFPREMLLAATTIDEALRFIREKMLPISLGTIGAEHVKFDR